MRRSASFGRSSSFVITKISDLRTTMSRGQRGDGAASGRASEPCEAVSPPRIRGASRRAWPASSSRERRGLSGPRNPLSEHYLTNRRKLHHSDTGVGTRLPEPRGRSRVVRGKRRLATGSRGPGSPPEIHGRRRRMARSPTPRRFTVLASSSHRRRPSGRAGF